MNYLDFENMGYYDLKSHLNDYVLTRIKEIDTIVDESEFDFCTTQGRIDELQKFYEFLNSNSLKSLQEKKLNNQSGDINSLD